MKKADKQTDRQTKRQTDGETHRRRERRRERDGEREGEGEGEGEGEEEGEGEGGTDRQYADELDTWGRSSNCIALVLEHFERWRHNALQFLNRLSILSTDEDGR